MASSDDEAEAQPLSVSNYHFEDEKDAPVSFSVLPIQWSESESPAGKKRQVFLHGVADNGLQKIFMQVVAWRFDLSYVRPEVSVLSKDGRWIKLLKPRKSFEDTIRTILITVHFLHYVKKSPEISARSVWDNLCKDKEFSSYEVMPSQIDLLNHMALMGEAAKRDAVLAKSKLLLMVLEEKLGNKKLSDEEVKDLARPGFIIDDVDNDMIDEAAEESDGEDELFDSVCAFCDNGGILLCCDGKCMRSFHATEEDGTESICVSLGFTQKEVDEIQSFYCKNCEYNQHQCFACGKLGSSDKFSGAEVFKCASATCGLFYHPHCVAKLLHRVVEDAPKELEKNIADGEPFTCPTHYCYVCKEMENKKEHDLQFAVCRRCPKSYHRKCLPRKIAFEDIEDEDIITRAWEGLLPNNRILIYCLKHEIDDELGTPIRDHIKFPNVKATVREINTSKEEKTKPATEERVILNKNNVDLDNSFGKRTTAKVSKLSGKMSSGKVGIKKSEKISGSNISRKPKANEAARRCLNENKRSISKEAEKSDCEENQTSLGERLYALLHKGSEQIKTGNQVDNVANSAMSVKPTKKLSSALPPLDADSEKRLLAMFNEASSSITLENVLKEHKFASTHTHSLKNVVEKTITVGKLEGSVDAVRTALRKLEDGHSIRDAEAVCDPDVLSQIFKWKDKLKVYLAPVLYGNRYSSYGRHFTQVEKLEGIVDKLHCYVQNGDTIVDFCCGANDFGILMKKKLDETGKRCSYKNYDLLPTKNDFCFEMRDWMTVRPNELPTGSQLIMGLNPPFGLKAALANKFIDKALEFKPKLLILIVPPETERLDKKRSPYDLVWEDEKFLSGKSFYLPGSVDVNDRQIDQWNVRPPPLYLWSRPDWTTKHKVIAQEHGHLFSQHEVLKLESFGNEVSPASHTMDDNYGDMLGHDLLKSTDYQEDHASMSEGQKGSSPHGNVDRESQEGLEYRMGKAEKTSWKRKQTEENDGSGLGVASPAKRQAVNQVLEEGVPDHSQPNPIDGRSSVEGFHPKSVMTSPYFEVGDNGYRHLEPTSCSRMEFGTAYGGTQKWPSVASPLSDYGVTNIEEHHSSLLGDRTNSLGYRPYIREDENYLRELDARQHVGLYGLQDPDSLRSNYLSAHDPAYGRMGSSYGVHGSVSESPYMTNRPAMERYAPRLDELNHVRMGSSGSEPPTVGRNGTFERSVPQPGYGSGMPGFASGPHHVYSRQNSAGRFNE